MQVKKSKHKFDRWIWICFKCFENPNADHKTKGMGFEFTRHYRSNVGFKNHCAKFHDNVMFGILLKGCKIEKYGIEPSNLKIMTDKINNYLKKEKKKNEN